MSRSVAFVATLMHGKGLDFAIADMPGHQSRLTLHVLAAAAKHERHMVGERTRHALAATKARGIKLGSPEQALVQRIKSPNSQAHILVLSMHEDPSIVARALEAGASGYVIKGAATEDLLIAIKTRKVWR